MESELLFSEKQRFNQWWLWIILLGVNALFVFGVFKQVILGQQFGDKPMSNTGLILVALGTILLSVLFLNFRLITQIRKDGVYVKFFPLHLSYRKYPWENISKAFIRTYNSLSEYGGWGVRYSLGDKGKALNVSGNKGLQLEFVDKKKLLIGTQKPEALENVLKQTGLLKE
jgi:hypothetical protein